MGLALWWSWQVKPKDPYSNKIRTFTISQGESVSQIANRLEKEKLINNSLSFKIIVKLLTLEKNIQAGDYQLSPAMDAKTIAQTLTLGSFDIWVTIPEGLRKEEIAGRLASSVNVNKEEFISLAREGYIFPDTYLIPKESSVKDILKIMEANFNKKISGVYNASNSSELNKVIILASIVEREAKHEEDRPIIAGILAKREKADWPLEADATVQYALGYDEVEKTWWKKNLTTDDLQINSPYNTRKNAGLPPAPIANPGLAAIKAVVNQKDSKYWYYLSDNNGTMHYAITLEEHNRNVSKYLSE